MGASGSQSGEPTDWPLRLCCPSECGWRWSEDRPWLGPAEFWSVPNIPTPHGEREGSLVLGSSLRRRLVSVLRRLLQGVRYLGMVETMFRWIHGQLLSQASRTEATLSTAKTGSWGLMVLSNILTSMSMVLNGSRQGFCPWGDLVACHNLRVVVEGCYCYLTRNGQECWETSHNAPDRPLTKNVHRAEDQKPWSKCSGLNCSWLFHYPGARL